MCLFFINHSLNFEEPYTVNSSWRIKDNFDRILVRCRTTYGNKKLFTPQIICRGEFRGKLSTEYWVLVHAHRGNRQTLSTSDYSDRFMVLISMFCWIISLGLKMYTIKQQDESEYDGICWQIHLDPRKIIWIKPFVVVVADFPGLHSGLPVPVTDPTYLWPLLYLRPQ